MFLAGILLVMQVTCSMTCAIIIGVVASQSALGMLGFAKECVVLAQSGLTPKTSLWVCIRVPQVALFGLEGTAF